MADATDFGDAPAQSVISREIPLQNRGSLPLHITSAQGDCGCTEVRAPAVVPAGGSGVITVHFNTAGYARKVVRHITIQSDDHRFPQRNISFTVYVQYNNVVEPLIVDLGTVHFGGQPADGQAVVWRSGILGQPRTLSISNLPEDLTATAAPWVRDGRDYRDHVHLALSALPPVGDHIFNIILHMSEI